MLGLQADHFVQSRGGFGQRVTIDQHPAKMNSNSGVLGCNRTATRNAAAASCGLAKRTAGVAKIVVCANGIGVNLNGAAVALGRFAEALLGIKRVAEIVLWPKRIRQQLHGLAVGVGRLRHAAECLQHLAVRIVICPLAWPQRDGAIDQRQAARRLPQLVGEQAQQMQAVGMIRSENQDLPIKHLRLRRVAHPMQ